LLQKPARSWMTFACTAAVPPSKSFLPTLAQFPAAPPVPPGPQDTPSSPTTSVLLSQVKTSNSHSKGHQSMLDPPLSVLPAAEPIPTQPIPDSVLEDVKRLLQKFPSIWTHGVKHHIHTGSHPQVFEKSLL
jgi:hypothetical protein